MSKNIEKCLTIVIPAYNVAHYLTKTLDSLVCCKHASSLDIIVINDGSTDRTEEIGRNYATLNAGSVRCISKENGGHGSGINTGLKLASGKYFSVLDGDDWGNTDALDHIIEIMASATEDVLAANYQSYNMESGETVHYRFGKVEYGRSYSIDDLVRSSVPLVMHELFYRTDLLREIKLNIREKVSYDDEEYCTMPFIKATSVRFIDEEYYVYRQGGNNQSMSPENQLRRYRDKYEVLQDMIRYVDQPGIEAANLVYMQSRIDNVITSVYFLWLITCPNQKEGRRKAREFREWLKKEENLYYRRTTKLWILFIVFHALHFDTGRWNRFRDSRKKLLAWIGAAGTNEVKGKTSGLPRIAFVIATPLQLFNCLLIMKHHFPERQADLFALDIACDMRRVIEYRKRDRQIHKVYYAYDVCKHASRIGTVLDHLYTPSSSKRILKDCKLTDYSDFFTTFNDTATTEIYTKLWKNNPDIRLHFYEEGTGVYTTPLYQDYGRIKTMYKLLGYRSETDYVEDLYVYCPSLYHGDLKTVEIGTVSEDDKEEFVSEQNFRLRDYDKRIIFFDNPMDKPEYKGVDQFRILADMEKATGRSNIMVRVHPRDQSGVFEERGYTEDANTSIPWEEILLHQDISDNILVTTFSTAVFSPKIICGQEPRVIFLKRALLENNGSESEGKMDSFDRFAMGVKEMYRDPSRVFIPRTLDEMIAQLREWLK